ncbi:2,3-bisphosphoglycerate-independent phosphoglycerate mutase [Sulfolobales archaeon SCGC AB-777_J03]|nr:2,3-bisphosphoglycerate-independent phosphoglycerate mutase [Sulfolobales archaeon SCGC AB-777_J03]
MRQYKILLIIADGLGDRPTRELNGRTPLEAADKPNLRELIRSSVGGLMDPIAPGVRAGSDTSHLAIFGLDPFKYYRGRGAFEAIGAGAVLEPGDVAFRGNFATVKEDFTVIDRRAGRKIEEADDLVRELNERVSEIDGVKVMFFHGTEHRVAVVLRGQGLSDKVSDTDPHEVNKRVLESRPLDGTKEAERTAEVLNKLTRRVYEVLSQSELNKLRVSKGLPPANVILLRGASIFEGLPKFKDYTGLNAGAVSATALIKGICKQLGMDVITPPGATGGVDSDLNAKADAAAKMLEEKDFVFVHVKGTDAASHDGNARAKVDVIERIDRMIGRILDRVGSELVIAFTGDHTTPVEVKEHTSDPVPFMLYLPFQANFDGLSDFNEREVKKGSLRIRGLDVTNLLLGYSNRAEKYGA